MVPKRLEMRNWKCAENNKTKVPTTRNIGPALYHDEEGLSFKLGAIMSTVILIQATLMSERKTWHTAYLAIKGWEIVAVSIDAYIQSILNLK